MAASRAHRGCRRGIVVTLEALTIDDTAPAGIAGHAVTDISLATYFALVGEGRVGDQRASQKYDVGSAVGEGCFTLVRVGDIADTTGCYLGCNFPQLGDVIEVGMTLAVSIGKVLIQ